MAGREEDEEVAGGGLGCLQRYEAGREAATLAGLAVGQREEERARPGAFDRTEGEREECTIFGYFCFEIFGGLCEGIKREMRVFLGFFFIKGKG